MKGFEMCKMYLIIDRQKVADKSATVYCDFNTLLLPKNSSVITVYTVREENILLRYFDLAIS